MSETPEQVFERLCARAAEIVDARDPGLSPPQRVTAIVWAVRRLVEVESAD